VQQDLTLVTIPEADHFVQQDAADPLTLIEMPCQLTEAR
jgi:hypothetical protein